MAGEEKLGVQGMPLESLTEASKNECDGHKSIMAGEALNMYSLAMYYVALLTTVGL